MPRLTHMVDLDEFSMAGVSAEERSLLSGENNQVDVDEMAMAGISKEDRAMLSGREDQVDVNELAVGGLASEELGIVQARMRMLDQQDEVFNRDNNKCVRCKVRWPSEQLSIVRVVKRPDGPWVGSDFVTACNKCIQELINQKALAKR